MTLYTTPKLLFLTATLSAIGVSQTLKTFKKELDRQWELFKVAAIEGRLFISTGQLVSLSEQNLVDCVNPAVPACKGESRRSAFEYAKRNGGINTEQSYPYEGRGDGRCRFLREDIGATIREYNSVKMFDEEQLRRAVAQGPVSVQIYATNRLQHYKANTIFDDLTCATAVDNFNNLHAVVVVGYGTTEEGEDYWILKNSWGQDWGDQGYFMFARNQNICNIGKLPLYPVR